MVRRHVLLLHTGGTLGMAGGQPGPFRPDGDPLDALLSKVPELGDVAEIRVEVLAQQDSCDVRAEQWITWAERIRKERWANGVVLVHGTDTMAWTASALSFLLEERAFPVVLTGSQRPLSAIRNDARQNLIDAVTVAIRPVNEVMICFGRLGLRANRTLKLSSALMNAFGSPNCQPLVSLGVDLQWHGHHLKEGGKERALRVGDQVRLSWVVPGLPAPEPWRPEENAVHVLATMGAGNLPHNTGWTELIQSEVEAGVIHLTVTQCMHGGVQIGMYEASRILVESGALSGGDMTWISAVTKARVGLGQGFSQDILTNYLADVVAGERTTRHEHVPFELA